MSKAMNETKTHLIADESLGGLQREYVEVDQKADVGDYVYLVNVESIHMITSSSKLGDYNEQIQRGSIVTLEPTDIVHYEGARYRLVDRKAEVGEKVVIINVMNEYHTFDDVNVGDMLEVSYVFKDEDNAIRVVGRRSVMLTEEYRVLEPVEEPKIYTCDRCDTKLGEIACSNSLGGSYCSVKCADISEALAEMKRTPVTTVDTSQASPAVIEMLGNLAQRIVELEKTVSELSVVNARLLDEIDTLHSNQKRLGEELANQSQKTPFDADEVIVELAKLLVESHRSKEAK